MALPAIEPAVEPTAEPCCKRKKPAVLHHGLNYILTQASVSSETLAYACGFVSFRYAEASHREAYFVTLSSRLPLTDVYILSELEQLCLRSSFSETIAMSARTAFSWHREKVL